jgi:hypothetical protein
MLLRQWTATAADVQRFLAFAMPLLQTPAPPVWLIRECNVFLEPLCVLPRAQREQLYAALGEWAAGVRPLVGTRR